MFFRISDLLIHRNTLRESESEQWSLDNLMVNFKYDFFILVPTKSIRIHCNAKRACLQPRRTQHHRSRVEGASRHRDFYRSSYYKPHLTAAVAFNRRVFYVNVSRGKEKCSLYFVGKLCSDRKSSRKSRYQSRVNQCEIRKTFSGQVAAAHQPTKIECNYLAFFLRGCSPSRTSCFYLIKWIILMSCLHEHFSN